MDGRREVCTRETARGCSQRDADGPWRTLPFSLLSFPTPTIRQKKGQREEVIENRSLPLDYK